MNTSSDPSPPPGTGAAAPDPTGRRRKITRRAFLGGGAGLLLAAGGGTAWALDRFVIDHVQVADASSISAQNVAVVAAESSAAQALSTTSGSGATTTSSATATDAAGYRSATTALSIEKVVTGTGDDLLTYYVADVTVTNATVVRSAFAEDKFGENIVADPSEIAAGVNATFAINGDYYGFRDTGIVIRNGVAFRDAGARQGLAMDVDGSLRLYDETATTAADLIADGVWQTWSFGPGLVKDGAVVEGIDSVEIDTNFGNHSVQGRQPRTGIGMVAANHLLFVVADGRATGYSRGVTMTEFARIFSDRGAAVAYNLDGGGSSTMLLNDRLVNNPLGRGEERGTSDIIDLAG